MRRDSRGEDITCLHSESKQTLLFGPFPPPVRPSRWLKDLLLASSPLLNTPFHMTHLLISATRAHTTSSASFETTRAKRCGERLWDTSSNRDSYLYNSTNCSENKDCTIMTWADKPSTRQWGMWAKLQLMNISHQKPTKLLGFPRGTWERVWEVSIAYLKVLKTAVENLTMLRRLVKPQEVWTTFPSDGQRVALGVHSAWHDFTHSLACLEFRTKWNIYRLSGRVFTSKGAHEFFRLQYYEKMGGLENRRK